MMQSKKKKYGNIAGWIAFIIMTLSVLLLLYSTMELAVIPAKYMVILIALMVLFETGYLWLQRGHRLLPVRLIAAVLLTAVYTAGSGYLLKANATIRMITDWKVETNVVSVYVLAEDPAQTIEEAEDYLFGVVKEKDRDSSNQAIARLEKQYGFTMKLQEYEDMFDMVDALQTGEAGAIILNEAYVDMISEVEDYEWFWNGIRALSTSVHEVEVAVQVPEEADQSVAQSQESADSESANSESGQDAEEGAEINEGFSNGFAEGSVPAKGNTSGQAVSPVQLEKLTDYPKASELSSDCFMVYLSGIDTYGGVTNRSRSDVNILAVVNTSTKNILLLTTPRDYYIDMPVKGGSKDKLTHAGLYGVDVSVASLEQLYGVGVDYYLRMNFSGFINIIDALGGIDVYSEYDFSVENIGDFHKGYNSLDGLHSLAFARERYSFSSGDYQRGRNQMEVIKAIVSKLASSALLYRYTDVMNSIADCFQTNMTEEKIAALVRMQLNDMSSWNITTYSVSGTGSKEYTYSIPSRKTYVILPSSESISEAGSLIRQILGIES